MAVSVIITISQYTGNASVVVPYPTGFAFQDANWLRVYVTTAAGASTLLTSGTDYTVTGSANPAGGNVLTVVAYPATSKITIARQTPTTQLLDLEYNDRLPAQLVEDALDKLTFAVQELVNDKPLRFPKTEPLDNDTELPDPAARKSCVLGFDGATGEATLFQLPIPTVMVVPPALGKYVLTADNGVLGWTATVNCA